MKILVERPVVRNDRTSEIDVVFEVRSSAGAAAARSSKALNLCLVIDRSASMNGDKLEIAKRSCADIHARLKPDDQLTVVVFDHEAQVVINPQTPKDEVAGKLAAISSGGNTNLSLGWYLGLLELQTHMTPQHHNRL
ncbi:MAG TPA: VWA domain-containing protein, partial [Kofleriaceae bacterium]|nr:VWA domain-containing protein [Kofleriaceae bacterium]